MLTTIIINTICTFVGGAAGAWVGVKARMAMERRKAAGKLYMVPRPTPPAPVDPGGRAA